jgi:hypothetical protein
LNILINDKEFFQIDWLFEKYLYSRIGKPNQKCTCNFESGPIIQLKSFKESEEFFELKNINWNNSSILNFSKSEFNYTGTLKQYSDITDIDISNNINFDINLVNIVEFLGPLYFDLTYPGDSIKIETIESDNPGDLEIYVDNVLYKLDYIGLSLIDRHIKNNKINLDIKLNDNTNFYRVDVQTNLWIFLPEDYKGSQIDYPEIFNDSKNTEIKLNEEEITVLNVNKLYINVSTKNNLLLKVIPGYGEINCLEKRCCHNGISYTENSFVMDLENGKADLIKQKFIQTNLD